MTINKKAALPWQGQRAASKLLSKLHSISLSAWALSYSLEEARQSHERHRRHFRRLACCAGLALLQLAGGRHV
jgi:hypothetical protein